jgi:hypothetical protein
MIPPDISPEQTKSRKVNRNIPVGFGKNSEMIKNIRKKLCTISAMRITKGVVCFPVMKKKTDRISETI